MKGHKEAPHEGAKPLKCELCDGVISRKSHLKTLVNMVHEKKGQEYKCNLCNFTSMGNANLNKYERFLWENKSI